MLNKMMCKTIDKLLELPERIITYIFNKMDEMLEAELTPEEKARLNASTSCHGRRSEK